MPLTDNQIKGLKPGPKQYGKPDGGGLGIVVTPTGAKSFRTRYRFDGKAKIITHGIYPDISLAEARRMRDEAKALLARGIDPMAKPDPADRDDDGPATASGVDRERLFGTVVEEWWEKKKLPTIKPSNVKRVHTRVFDYLAAPLAHRPVDEIAPEGNSRRDPARREGPRGRDRAAGLRLRQKGLRLREGDAPPAGQSRDRP